MGHGVMHEYNLNGYDFFTVSFKIGFDFYVLILFMGGFYNTIGPFVIWDTK